MTEVVTGAWMRAPVWSAGFRAFFWLGALNAAASLATWMAFLSGRAIGTQGWPLQSLHAHEMLHGTVVPAIAGFLLTAVPTWSGTAPLRGAPVAGLVALWAVGRVALASADILPRGLVALLDGAFVPVLAVVVGVPIVRSRKGRNLSVVLLLFALGAANGAMHIGLMRADASLLRAGVYGSVYLAVLLILIISGRIVPLFTRNALRQSGLAVEVQGDPTIGALALSAAGLALTLDLVSPGSVAGGAAALVAGPLLAARQAFWKPRHALGRPILWILHVGHAWIAIGFVCHGVAVLAGVLPVSAALHSFTAGAMGCLILGMMTRVSLGHTGRPVKASRLTVAAYAAVIFAALLRVFGPPLAPFHTLPIFLVSGAAFAAGYLVFAIEFTAVLWRPRIDASPPPLRSARTTRNVS
jgi:uncharacterized protein involved in response to NO